MKCLLRISQLIHYISILLHIRYSTGSSSLDFDKMTLFIYHWDVWWFLNLPLWANFYNHTELSHSTSTMTLDQPTLLYMTSTLNQASPAAQVEAGWGRGWGGLRPRLRRVEAEVEAGWGRGWGGLRPSLLGWILLDDLNGGWGKVKAGWGTPERKLLLKINHNVPSFILVKGTKLRVHYAGQPKTCGRCHKYWNSCPGGGKMDKCKKAKGEEKPLKVAFKQLTNRIKKKEVNPQE